LVYYFEPQIPGLFPGEDNQMPCRQRKWTDPVAVHTVCNRNKDCLSEFFKLLGVYIIRKIGWVCSEDKGFEGFFWVKGVGRFRALDCNKRIYMVI